MDWPKFLVKILDDRGGGGSTSERRFKHIKKLTLFADPLFTPYFFDFREGGGCSHFSGEGGAGPGLRKICWGCNEPQLGIIGGASPPTQKYWGCKKNFSRRLPRRETPYFTLNFDFYCIFERQLFVKSAKFSFKPRKILGFDKKIDTKTTIFKKKISYANEKNGATRFSELAQATRCRPLNYYYRYPTLLRERKKWSYAFFGARACIPKNYYICYPSLLRERKKWILGPKNVWLKCQKLPKMVLKESFWKKNIFSQIDSEWLKLVLKCHSLLQNVSDSTRRGGVVILWGGFVVFVGNPPKWPKMGQNFFWIFFIIFLRFFGVFIFLGGPPHLGDPGVHRKWRKWGSPQNGGYPKSNQIKKSQKNHWKTFVWGVNSYLSPFCRKNSKTWFSLSTTILRVGGLWLLSETPQNGGYPKSNQIKKSQKNHRKFRSKVLTLYLSPFCQENSKTYKWSQMELCLFRS